MIEEFVFERGCHTTKTKRGKEVRIIKNDLNVKNQYYQVVVDGKTVATRCSMRKAIEIINNN